MYDLTTLTISLAEKMCILTYLIQLLLISKEFYKCVKEINLNQKCNCLKEYEDIFTCHITLPTRIYLCNLKPPSKHQSSENHFIIQKRNSAPLDCHAKSANYYCVAHVGFTIPKVLNFCQYRNARKRNFDQALSFLFVKFCGRPQAEVKDDIETHRGAVFRRLMILVV